MKVNNIFNIVGAAFMLAAIGIVVARPQIVSRFFTGIEGVINASTAPVRKAL